MRSSMKSLFVVMAVLVSTSAFGQSTEVVTVNATVASVLEFTVTHPVNGQTYNFGTVDALGVSANPLPQVFDPIAGTNTYTANDAFIWFVRAAPRGTGAISSTTAKAGGMAIGDLSVKLDRAGFGGANVSGTLTTAFTPLTAAAQNWLTAATIGAGNGALGAEGGTVDLELTVDDLDPVGVNTWTITFTANVT